jgi:hypothetical protein
MMHVHVYLESPVGARKREDEVLISTSDSHDLCGTTVSMTGNFHISHLSCKFSAGQSNTKAYLRSPSLSIPKRVKYKMTTACICYKTSDFLALWLISVLQTIPIPNKNRVTAWKFQRFVHTTYQNISQYIKWIWEVVLTTYPQYSFIQLLKQSRAFRHADWCLWTHPTWHYLYILLIWNLEFL